MVARKKSFVANEWVENTDSDGESILTKFYKDQRRYAFPFQVNALITRMKQLREVLRRNHNWVVVVERSILSGKHIFPNR